MHPTRSTGRQRLFSDADVERLRLLLRLLRLLRLATLAGRSISLVVILTTEALARMVEEDTTARSQQAPGEPGTASAADGCRRSPPTSGRGPAGYGPRRSRARAST